MEKEQHYSHMMMLKLKYLVSTIDEDEHGHRPLTLDLLKSAFLYSRCPNVIEKLSEELSGPLPLLFNKTGTGKFQKMRRNLLLSQYFERVKEVIMVIIGLSG